MNIKYTYLSLVALLGLGVLVSSCSRDRNNPGLQYAPEMYESIPLEPFTQVVDSFAPFKDKRNQQLPPEGTIARGQFAAFEFPLSEEDSIRHSDELKGMVNPVPRTAASLAEGEELYLRFCGACHGEKGAADGKVAGHDAINPVAYDGALLKGYTPGELYYVIMHGKGVMGSYASQLDYEDRWKVVHYVETLQGKEMAMEYETFDAASANVESMNVEDVFKLKDINFAVQGADLPESAQENLNELGHFMAANPTMVVQFEGHTDSDGDSTSNRALSLARANSVRDYLVTNGVPENRVKAEGFGSDFPVAPNTSGGNKAKNRRTEMKILEK